MIKKVTKNGSVTHQPKLPKPLTIKVDWELLFEELEQIRNDFLLEYLTKLNAGGVKIDSIQDEKNFNLLHHAVLKGQNGKVRFLIETAKKNF